jgi:REP element-mobilizing transposase RayT
MGTPMKLCVNIFFKAWYREIMPRQSRIDKPGALHHIICRGIEKRDIFKDDKDRDNFVRRLGTVLSETRTPCYAWALIPNHFHLLLRTGKVPVSTVMRRLLTGYAVSFNRVIKEADICFRTGINQFCARRIHIFWNLSGISI